MQQDDLINKAEEVIGEEDGLVAWSGSTLVSIAQDWSWTISTRKRWWLEASVRQVELDKVRKNGSAKTTSMSKRSYTLTFWEIGRGPKSPNVSFYQMRNPDSLSVAFRVREKTRLDREAVRPDLGGRSYQSSVPSGLVQIRITWWMDVASGPRRRFLIGALTSDPNVSWPCLENSHELFWGQKFNLKISFWGVWI